MSRRSTSRSRRFVAATRLLSAELQCYVATTSSRSIVQCPKELLKTGVGNMHYILFYEYAPDYLERRGEFRDQHMALAKASIDRGEFFLGGAFASPADGAAIVFKGSSQNVAESFAEEDPYVLNGLVTSWYVREWTTVAGKDAEQPIVA